MDWVSAIVNEKPGFQLKKQDKKFNKNIFPQKRLQRNQRMEKTISKMETHQKIIRKQFLAHSNEKHSNRETKKERKRERKREKKRERERKRKRERERERKKERER